MEDFVKKYAAEFLIRAIDNHSAAIYETCV